MASVCGCPEEGHFNECPVGFGEKNKQYLSPSPTTDELYQSWKFMVGGVDLSDQANEAFLAGSELTLDAEQADKTVFAEIGKTHIPLISKSSSVGEVPVSVAEEDVGTRIRLTLQVEDAEYVLHDGLGSIMGEVSVSVDSATGERTFRITVSG